MPTPKPERKKNKEVRKNVEKFYARIGEKKPQQAMEKEAKSLVKGKKEMMKSFTHLKSK